MKHVMLIGGIYHPFDEYVRALTELGAEFGLETWATDSVEEAVAALDDACLLTNYALRWRMLNHEKYVPHRARWAFEMPPELGARVEQFVEDGGAMLGMHTASICFDTWAGYGDLLGGAWVWDQTFHPPPGPVQVEAIAGHPISGGLKPFTVTDEVYHHLAVRADSTPLLRARCAGADAEANEWHVVAWAREHGAGRVAYNALGHDGASLGTEGHKQAIRACLRWLLR